MIRDTPVRTVIRARRKSRGFGSQATLAAALGVSERQVLRWENGQQLPGPENRDELARLLGGEPDDYKGDGTDDRPYDEIVRRLEVRLRKVEERAEENERALVSALDAPADLEGLRRELAAARRRDQQARQQLEALTREMAELRASVEARQARRTTRQSHTG